VILTGFPLASRICKGIALSLTTVLVTVAARGLYAEQRCDQSINSFV
jgi:hypothetical protein